MNHRRYLMNFGPANNESQTTESFHRNVQEAKAAFETKAKSLTAEQRPYAELYDQGSVEADFVLFPSAAGSVKHKRWDGEAWGAAGTTPAAIAA